MYKIEDIIKMHVNDYLSYKGLISYHCSLTWLYYRDGLHYCDVYAL